MDDTQPTPPAIVEEQIQTGATPARPGVAARAGQAATLAAEAHQEYVAAGGRTWHAYGNAIMPLPWAIDDITRDFGADLYLRMLRDPQCLAVVNIFKASILDSGIRLASARPKPEQDGHKKAARLLEFCQEALDRIDTLTESLWNQLDAIAVGNKIAEQTYIDHNGRLWLDKYKVKPARSLAFAVDAYMNVIGLLATIPGVSSQAQTGTLIGDVSVQPNLLPRGKFAILSFRSEDSDPRGTSILRAAYTPWWAKMQVYPEYLKFLAQFAGPSIVGVTAPDAKGDYDYDGDGLAVPGSYKSAERRLADALLELRNGSAIAVPNGAAVTPLAVDYAAGGTAFDTAFGLFDRQIVKAVLHQTLATEEAQHGTRAQASVHQDALSMVLVQAKLSVARMIRADILRALIRYNFGDKYVPLTPLVNLGETEQQDVTPLMLAVAALERVGWFTDSQRPAVDSLLNLPQRTPEELAQAATLVEQALKSSKAAEAQKTTDDPTTEEEDTTRG